MNIIKKYTNGLVLAVLAMGAMVFTSCEDEPDKFEPASGKPTVKYIRCLSTEIKNASDAADTHYTNGQLVTSAAPGSTVALIGENMRSVREIWFNDQQGSLNTSTLTDNVLISSIPNVVPQEVSDKIFLITNDNDTVAYEFKVTISAPVINSMGNEYAAAGELEQLKGNYFIDDPNVPLTISFTGAGGELIPAKIMKIDENFTYVNFIVPEGAEEGPIVVTSVYGTTKSSFYYKDKRGLLFDFDLGGQIMDSGSGKIGHGWHQVICQSDETSLEGKYMQLGNGVAAIEDGSWDDGNFSFEYWPGAWQDPEPFTDALGKKLTDYFDASNWENMSLKFEINVPTDNAWSACALQIIFGGTDKVSNGATGAKDTHGNTLAGCNNTYFNNNVLPRILYRPWTTEGVFSTSGNWQTVTIPLKAALIYGADGSLATGSIGKDDFTSLMMFLWSGGTPGTKCTPIIKIDNIRIVPNK